MIDRTGETIVCDPRGSYNDLTCPVCGKQNYSDGVDVWADNDSFTDWYECGSCGSLYYLTYRLTSISIEKDGRF